MTDPRPTDDRPQVISENRAKQGRRGLHILVVLVISATLAALALFAVWMSRSGDLAQAEATEVNEPHEAAIVDQPVEAAQQTAPPTS